MLRLLLALALLALSGYVWPLASRKSLNSDGTFLLSLCLGLGSLLLLVWLFRRIDAWGPSVPSPSRCASLVWRGIPVILLQVLLGITYWTSFVGLPQHLGEFTVLPFYFLAPWIVVDAGIRGVVEEGVFRGMLQPALVRRYEAYAGATWIAITLTTFWFMVAHIYGVSHIRLLPYLGFLSLCYGYLVAQTRSVVSSVILHVGHNAGALVAAYLGLAAGLYGVLRQYSNGQAVIMMTVGGLLLANVWAIRWFARQSAV